MTIIKNIDKLDDQFEKLSILAKKFKIEIDYEDSIHYSWPINAVAHDIAHYLVNSDMYKKIMHEWRCKLCPFDSYKKSFDKKDKLIYTKDIMKTEEFVNLTEELILEYIGFTYINGMPKVEWYNDENFQILNDMKILDGKKLIIPQ